MRVPLRRAQRPLGRGPADKLEHPARGAEVQRVVAQDLGGTGQMFDIVRRQAAERVLRPPHSDPDAVWALATLAALLSGDWLNAREPKNQPGTRAPGRDDAGPVPG